MIPISTIRRSFDDPALSLYLVAGIVGALSGMVFANYSIMVGIAQYLVGLVPYPVDTPHGILYQRTVTLPVEAFALLLKAGLSEREASIVTSCVVSVVHYQAFVLIAYAFCGRALPALAIMAVAGFETFGHGADYPIGMFTGETYGALALGVSIHVAALIAVGWYRGAGLTAGLLAGIHPVMALWTLALTAAIAWVFRRTLDVRSAIPWLGAGLAVSAAGIAYGLGIRVSSPAIPPPDPAFLRVFLELWDVHRNVPIGIPQVVPLVMAVATLSAMSAWLAYEGRSRAPAPRFAAALVTVGGLVAVVLYLGFHAAREVLPVPVLIAMPNRFLNILTEVSPVVMAGMLASRRHPLALVGLVVMLVGAMLFFIVPMPEVIPAGTFEAATLVLASLAAVVVFSGRVRGWEERPAVLVAGLAAVDRLTTAFAAKVSPAVLVGLVALGALGLGGRMAPLTYSRAVEDFIQALERTEGLLLLADGLTLVRSPTHRPVLLDPNRFDYIPYVPEAAPAVADILGAVYGVDYFNPPRSTRFKGALAKGISRDLWESRGRDEWLRLAGRYGIGAIMAPSDWRIDLPRVYRLPGNPGLTIFSLRL
ncbi:MAG: hypothetical protein H7840_07665 [Alphaproteobacteria bacterium]